MMSDTDYETALQKLVDFFAGMTPSDVARMGDFYVDDAFFKDPFNEVRDLPSIQRIFDRMFEDVEAPHFQVTGTVRQLDQAFITWNMRFTLKRMGKPFCIRGCSHVRMHEDGRVGFHRDYWDAAEELYEKLPLIGVVMRALRRRNSA